MAPGRQHKSADYAIGIDLGCTNIKGLAVTRQGRVLAEISLPTQDDNSRQRRWAANVRRVLEQLERAVHREPAWLGLAAPGIAAPDQRSIRTMPGRLPGLEGLVWTDFLHNSTPVPVLNDAQAALLGEVWRGAARGARNAILLTLGTGVGGAALVDGRLLRGHIGRAGHLGHISLDPQGTRDVANTPGSLENAIGDCTIAARSGDRFSSTLDLLKAVRRHDAQARQVWSDSVHTLAAGIASLVNVLDPEIVVLGGGITKAGPALFRPLRKFLEDFEWRPAGARVRITPAELSDRAGAFGAAWNALQSP
jgi:glucokinase